MFCCGRRLKLLCRFVWFSHFVQYFDCFHRWLFVEFSLNFCWIFVELVCTVRLFNREEEFPFYVIQYACCRRFIKIRKLYRVKYFRHRIMNIDCIQNRSQTMTLWPKNVFSRNRFRCWNFVSLHLFSSMPFPSDVIRYQFLSFSLFVIIIIASCVRFVWVTMCRATITNKNVSWKSISKQHELIDVQRRKPFCWLDIESENDYWMRCS